MNKDNDNNNLFVENPTVEYQESQKQKTYDKRVEPYNNEEDTYNNEEESFNNEENSFNNEKNPFNNNEEPSTNDEQPYKNVEILFNNEQEPINRKDQMRMKQNKLFSNPFIVAAILYVFWPGGIFCMWKFNVFNKTARIIISIVMPVFAVIRIMGMVPD